MSETVALLALMIAVIGWPVSHWLSRAREIRLERDRLALEILKRRLDEFYAPIYGLLLENERIRSLVNEQIGKPVIFDGHELSPPDEAIWIHYLEEYLIPNNRKILNIIQTKMHLFVGDSFPDSLRAWIDHALGYELFHGQYRRLGREYGLHSHTNFPEAFRTDVIQAISTLMQQQRQITGSSIASPFLGPESEGRDEAVR